MGAKSSFLLNQNLNLVYSGGECGRGQVLIVALAGSHQVLQKLMWFLPETAKMVKVIESKEAFQEALASAGDKLVVVDFSATWCGPCKMIKPFFHSLSEKYSSVVFLEVDVDDCQDVAAECEVKCMLTFQFYKKGQKGFPDIRTKLKHLERGPLTPRAEVLALAFKAFRSSGRCSPSPVSPGL
ncbi:hypothetical protein STEG23_006419 [Scotinomys teguina]